MATRRRQARARPAPDAREAWLDALPDAYTDCRDVGHAWRPHAGGWDVAARCWVRVLRCPRCRTERHQIVNDAGHVVSNRYAYPDGYLAPAGADPLSRDAFRLAALTRQYDDTKRKAG